MKQQLTGGAYQARSLIAAAQRSLNLIPEPLPDGTGEPSTVSSYPTPGLRKLGTIGTGPIRGIRQATTGGIYVVSGSTVYSVNAATWAGTALGTITPGLTTPVSMADNGLELVIVDGTPNGWHVTLAGETFAPIPIPPENPDTKVVYAFYGADRADFLETFFTFNKPGTPIFYWSLSLDITVDSNDFASKQTYSDLLITQIVAKREIYLLGERTTEIWYHAGLNQDGSGLEFNQVQGVFIDHGIVAKYSAANYDNGIFWLSRDRQGQGLVLNASDYKASRISTYAIENEISGYARIDDAIGYTYQLGGHAFYVLTFPHADRTWVYDITTKQWHEWCWLDTNGREHRHRSNCHWACAGLNVVGDWQNGNLYALDSRVFTDDGQPIKRQRSFPHLVNELNRVFYQQFTADLEGGNPGAAYSVRSGTFLNTSFTAPDGTLLSRYSNASDTNANWTLLSGSDAAIMGNRLAGPTGGGSSLYRSPPAPGPDYSLQFRATPTDYAAVPVASLFAIARSTGPGTGYRATVAGDGARYQLTLGVEGGASTTIAMGTIASGAYLVTMNLRGALITLTALRTNDMAFLQPDGTWSAAKAPAITLDDGTYPAGGSIMIGGNWSAAGLRYALETPLGSDPNFPSGYTYQNPTSGRQTFDFARNRFYVPITGSGVGGIAITDLSTMAVARTVTLAQMYAGTAYGFPPGSPPTQDIFDVTCGDGTDLYILTTGDPTFSPASEYTRFTRVDPNSMKVTGEFYISRTFPPPITCVLTAGWQLGIVNTTASRTIVLYPINGSLHLGPEIFDGTSMAPIGLGPTPRDYAYNLMFTAGAKHPDGSCDFYMLDPDSDTPASGQIDIWRINVSNTPAITSTKTGTLNVLSVFTPTTKLFVGQVEYDGVHDTLIVTATNGASPNAAPSWIMSVNYDGTINWTHASSGTGGSTGNKSQYNLTGTTYVFGQSDTLTMLDTGTGAVTFTGSILVAGTLAGSYFHVWDASRASYWTYALSRGFVRIDLLSPLAMDDVIAIDQTPVRAASTQVFLDWSDDRGHSFGNPVGQPIGATGEYRTTVSWNRLGYGRDRVHRLTWSVPVATALQGAFIDLSSAKT